MAKAPEGSARFDRILGDISTSVDAANTDRRKRQILLKKLESGNPQPRRVVLYYSRLEKELSHHDILPFASMLRSVGPTPNLDLIIHSPGGDGLAAEKILDLCRKYCTGTLRVAVPLYAKSAATLIALGADEILRGETSELGPIDAQLYIIQDNSPHQVSADHYLRARDDAIRKLASNSPEEVRSAQIQLALLSPAFLQQCRDLMDFGRDFARKQLETHMFKVEFARDPNLWKDRINRITDNLTASSKRLTHGRMITATEIQCDPDLRHLKVVALPNADPYWVALDELLLRTDVVCRSQEIGKILFARKFQLVSG
jgi:hypothetical protein